MLHADALRLKAVTLSGSFLANIIQFRHAVVICVPIFVYIMYIMIVLIILQLFSFLAGNIRSRDSMSFVRRTRRLRTMIDENEAGSSAKYACIFCKDSFQYKSAFKLHLLKHTGDKPYHCDVCGKQFRRKSRYEGHVRNHTGDKPYECKECGLRFPQSGNLYYHAKTRHVTKNPLLKKDTRRKSDLNVGLDVEENNLQEGSRICSQCPDGASGKGTDK